MKKAYIYLLITFTFISFSYSKNLEKFPVEILSLKENEEVNVLILTENKNIVNGEKFELFPLIKAKLNKKEILELAKNKDIRKIYLDKEIRIFRKESTQIMNINLAIQNFLVNGSEINISIIDTGIYPHQEFQNRIILQKCFISHGTTKCPPNNTNESNNATDDNGHGTHVAGIAAGINGVAKNASIIAVKVLNASGYGYTSDLIKGIEFAVKNKAKIISLSLGSYENCYEDILDSFLDNVTEMNIVVVAAAGNDGPSNNTISSPSCAKKVIAVGSVNKNTKISSFSSRGPTSDNRIKPDLMAIGENVNSTWLNNNYYIASGTSMATPFVSGIAALLLEYLYKNFGYYPSPHLIKAILLTATNITSMNQDGFLQRNNFYGSGLVDANEALRISSFYKIDNKQNWFSIFPEENILKVTLYWADNSTENNNLDLIVSNGSLNYVSNSSNDNVEQIFIYNFSKGFWKIYVNTTSNKNYYLVANSKIYDFVINSPLNNYNYNNSNIHFNLSINKPIENAFVEIDNSKIYLTNSSLFEYYNNSIQLNTGNYSAKFVINFSTYLENFTINFSVFIEKPNITIVSPENISYNTPLINLNYSFSNSTFVTCYYSLNFGSNISLDNCQNATLFLNDGSYILTLYLNDSFGNFDVKNITFTINSTPKILESGINKSKNVVGKFEAINISAKVFDNNLQFAWLATNESGILENKTFLNITNQNLTIINFTWQNISLEIGSIIKWIIFVNDSIGNLNSTEGYFEIDKYPPIFNNFTFSNANYSLDFTTNISFVDDNLNKVIFESNFSGELKNYSANKNDNFFFVIEQSNLTVGKFVIFRFCANDTSNLFNCTNWQNFTVNKYYPKISLLIDNFESNKSVLRGSLVNITSFSDRDINVSLELNGSLIANNLTIKVILNTSNMLGNYNLTSYINENENYSFSFKTFFLNVYALPNGYFCSNSFQCLGNYCSYGYCSDKPYYCGNSICENGESCSSCSIDCGPCQTLTEYKETTKPLEKHYYYDFILDFNSNLTIEENLSKVISMKIKNIGNGTLTNFSIKIEHDKNCCDINLSEEYFQKILPNEEKNILIYFYSKTPGYYYANIKVFSNEIRKEYTLSINIIKLEGVVKESEEKVENKTKELITKIDELINITKDEITKRILIEARKYCEQDDYENCLKLLENVLKNRKVNNFRLYLIFLKILILAIFVLIVLKFKYKK